MFRRIAISLAALLVALAAVAQPVAATVRGQILRADGGGAYEAATVTLVSPSGNRTATVYTGRDGKFYLRRVAAGRYTMEVQTNRSRSTFRIAVAGGMVFDVAPVRVR